MKKLMLAGLLALMTLPAMAHNTRAGDVVNVESTTYDAEGLRELARSVYAKPWGQIKISPATNQKIDRAIARYRAMDMPDKSFRVIYLTVVNNDVQRALVLTDLGTAIAIELQDGRFCHTSVAGNGRLGAECSD